MYVLASIYMCWLVYICCSRQVVYSEALGKYYILDGLVGPGSNIYDPDPKIYMVLVAK